jgi:hypothetical protein
VITEIGFLFPKSGQLLASKRRKRLRCVPFATAFWIAFFMFGLPVLLGIASGLIQGANLPLSISTEGRSSGSGEKAPSYSAPPGSLDAGHAAPSSTRTPADARGNSSMTPQPREPVKPRIIFAPAHEVVQAIPYSSDEPLRACSGIVVDHWVEQ